MPIAIPTAPPATPRPTGLELLFLGTGESVATPYVSYLTADMGDGSKDVCRGCTTALDPITQHPLTTEAGKNARGNTCAIVRRTWSPQDQAKNGNGKASSVILIDCGKTFLSSAIKYMQRHGIREIDAVLLSHEHADAIGGLDDLTQWKRIQSHLDVYCDARTLKAVERKFPYLVSQHNTVGSGSLAALVWHVIEEGEVHNIAGVPILPLPVQHGWLKPDPASDARTPYLIPSFLIDNSLLWMSDVREIPETTLQRIRQHTETDCGTSTLSLVVIDGNDSIANNIWLPHGRLHESLASILALGCQHNLLVGMGHHTVHQGLDAVGRELQGARLSGDEDDYVAATRAKVPDDVWKDLVDKRVHIRPAYDGLKVTLVDDDVDGAKRLDGMPF